MRDFIQLLTALAVLAAVQYLAATLSVVLCILLLMAAIVHPRRTLQLLAAIGLLALAFKAPAYCAVAISAGEVAMAVAANVTRQRRRPAPNTLPLLTYGGTDGTP